jgi:hypothetical protein
VTAKLFDQVPRRQWDRPQLVKAASPRRELKVTSTTPRSATCPETGLHGLALSIQRVDVTRKRDFTIDDTQCIDIRFEEWFGEESNDVATKYNPRAGKDLLCYCGSNASGGNVDGVHAADADDVRLELLHDSV